MATYDLTEILSKAAPGSVVKLQPGIYYIGGVDESGSANPGQKIPKGVRLLGRGRDRTFILLKHNFNRTLTTLFGEGGNVVADLTVSGEHFFRGKEGITAPYKINGIWLDKGGPNNIISNVRVIGTYGNYDAHKESFGATALGPGALITDSEFIGGSGSYSGGFLAESGMITKCSVYYPPLFDNELELASMNWWGIGAIFPNKLRITMCSVTNGRIGFYYDTGFGDKLMISQCLFKGVPYGIWLKQQSNDALTAQVLKNTVVTGNTFLLRSRPGSCGVLFDNTRLDSKPDPVASGGFFQASCSNNTFIAEDTPLAIRPVCLASNCPNPVVDKVGIIGITLVNNEFKPGVSWRYRNKGQNAKAVTVEESQVIPWDE